MQIDKGHRRKSPRIRPSTGSTTALAMFKAVLISAELTNIVGVPTSKGTKEQATSLNISLTTLDTHSRLNLAIDGADEVDLNFYLVQGLGGALLRKKMLAVLEKFIVVVDNSKLISGLSRFSR